MISKFVNLKWHNDVNLNLKSKTKILVVSLWILLNVIQTAITTWNVGVLS